MTVRAVPGGLVHTLRGWILQFNEGVRFVGTALEPKPRDGTAPRRSRASNVQTFRSRKCASMAKTHMRRKRWDPIPVNGVSMLAIVGEDIDELPYSVSYISVSIPLRLVDVFRWICNLIRHADREGFQKEW